MSSSLKDLGAPPSCDEQEEPAAKNALTCHVGNPIHAGTGNKFESRTDYRSHNSALAFTRYFNSQDKRTGTLGQNWRHSLERSIVFDGSSKASIIRPDGRTYLFTLTNGQWQGDADVTAKLLHLADGSWSYTLHNGTVERYNSAGQMTRLTARNGQSLVLSYSAGHLAEVTDDFDKALQLSYNASGLLDTLTLPDSGSYHYHYTSNKLTRVTNPDESYREYLYEDSRFPGYLTGIIDERGNRFASWGYDAQGRAILSEHANGAERVELTYNADGTTTVRDAAGGERTYEFSSINGSLKATRVIHR